MTSTSRPKMQRAGMGDSRYTWSTFGLQLLGLAVSFFFLFPFLMIINNSFKSQRELLMNPPLSMPSSFGFTNYVNAWKKLNLGVAFSNSLFYTVVAVVLIALLCTITAWAIARGKGKLFRASRVYFLIGILIPSQALCLPIYILWNSFGLINTNFGLIALYISTGLSFGIFLQTNFMSTVPVDIEEAAQIDGCSVYRTFFSIVLPLLRAPMSTLIIVQSFSIWNDYMLTNLMIQSTPRRTVTLALKTLFSSTANDYATAMAAIILAATPIIILFVALQKQFVKGMTMGAVKG
ncbi:carbohydrate ABC transporter permease [Eubacteriales bacterium OttesenSCG-928-N13]|nr:carbohydrate ABC transporter permease [Eubacteriales bacterium OttesenSCG-928-N13]